MSYNRETMDEAGAVTTNANTNANTEEGANPSGSHGSHRDGMTEEGSRNSCIQLPFHKVGLVGREMEIRLLSKAIESSSKKAKSTSFSAIPRQNPQDSPRPSSKNPQEAHNDHREKLSIIAHGDAGVDMAITRASKDCIADHIHGDIHDDMDAITHHSTANQKAKKGDIRTLVHIAGQSGSGKSALVQHVKQHCLSGNMSGGVQGPQSAGRVRSSRLFASGKCELSTKNEGVPFAGIQTAMIELCQQIGASILQPSGTRLEQGDDPPAAVFHDDTAAHKLRSLLSKGLSVLEVHLLSHVIPNIDSIIKSHVRRHPSSIDNSTKVPPSPASALTSLSHSIASDSSHSVSMFNRGDDLASVGYREHTDRLKYVLRRFMQILCKSCSVVLAIDDLQWADQASLSLIQSWLLDNRNKSLTIITSYRSNMLDNNQHLRATFASLEESKRERSIRIIKIRIEDLDVEEVTEYLTKLFLMSATPTAHTEDPEGFVSLPTDRLRSLALVVHEKTGGNVLFMQQYLESLVKDGLITHQPISSTIPHTIPWEWDMDKLTNNTATSSSNSVIDLIKSKLQKVVSARQVLPIAACLGATFSLSNVCLAMKGLSIHSDHSGFFRRVFQITTFFKDSEIRHMLNVCCNEGLIRQTSRSGQASAPRSPRKQASDHQTKRPSATQQYFFVHDKVQEAALAMVTKDEELAELKYRVGEILLYGQSASDLQDKIFTVANLLNTRPDLMPTCEQMDRRIKIIMLNYRAGQQAVQVSAFQLASNYFATAIDLLPHDHWKVSSTQSLEMFSSAAESAYIMHDFDKARSYCAAIIDQECNILSKVRAYHVLVDVCLADTSKGEESGAINICFDVLSQLGCNFPKSNFGQARYVARNMLMAKSTSRRLERDMRDAITFSDDSYNDAAMRTLDKLTMAAYLIEPGLVPLVTLKILNRSLKHGISTQSAPALAFQGIIVGFVLGDFDRAEKCGKLALDVLKVSDDRSLDSRTLLYYYIHIYHWKHPLETIIDPLFEAYRLGMSTGDVSAGMWSLFSYFAASYHSNRSLETLDAELSTHTRVMKDFRQESQHLVTRMVWQAALNLRGQSKHTTQLIGDAYDIRQARATGDISKLEGISHDMTSLLLGAVFGEYEAAAQTALTCCWNWLDTMPSSYSLVPTMFCSALCCFIASRSSTTNQRKYKMMAHRCHSKLKEWQSKGNPNGDHLIVLLNAERNFLRRRHKKTSQYYLEAIRLANARRYRRDEAMANERYAMFLAHRGDFTNASIYMDESIRLYGEWGAHGKVQQLMKARK